MLKQQFSRHETSQSSNVFPVDLLIDIFSRVPAKSIARFRSLSKFWAFIFRRHDFTELFLTKSCARPRLLFTFDADGKLFFYSTPQPHNPNDDDSSLVATPYHTSFPEYFPSGTYSLVCGLVLLQGWVRKVRVVCNPATGEFLTLPKVLLKEKTKLKAQKKEKIARMYLGYDPISKQFKVLCMTTTSSTSYEVRDNTHQVLTLTPGKRFWRPVEHKFHFVKNYRIWGDICINGVLYFAAESGGSSMIVCFDVGSEKFSFINTNEDMGVGHCYRVASLNLFNYKGKLGIRHKEHYRLVFWVLEDAENHKWSTHIYQLSLFEGNLIRFSRFVGVTGTGDFVWSYHDPPNSFYLAFYSLEIETFTKVNIQGFDEFKQHSYISITTYLDYVENVKWVISDKASPTKPQNGAASGSKSKKPKSTQTHLVEKRNSIQKPSPTALSVNDKNRAWEEKKSRGKRKIATSSMETRCGPALSNRFAALDSLEDAG